MAELPHLLLLWATTKYGYEKADLALGKIIEDTAKDNVKTMKMQINTDSTIERLKKLYMGDQNIEYIILASPLVEASLMRLLTTYEFVTNSMLLLSDMDNPLQVHVNLLNDNNALGSLINELHRYSKNEKLFGLLSNFNGHKKKAGHKLYETNDDANAVNEKLREYVKTHPVGNILDAIRAEHAMLQKRLQDRLIDFGCTTSGVDTKTIRKRYEEENKSTPDGI